MRAKPNNRRTLRGDSRRANAICPVQARSASAISRPTAAPAARCEATRSLVSWACAAPARHLISSHNRNAARRSSSSAAADGAASRVRSTRSSSRSRRSDIRSILRQSASSGKPWRAQHLVETLFDQHLRLVADVRDLAQGLDWARTAAVAVPSLLLPQRTSVERRRTRLCSVIWLPARHRRFAQREGTTPRARSWGLHRTCAARRYEQSPRARASAEASLRVDVGCRKVSAFGHHRRRRPRCFQSVRVWVWMCTRGRSWRVV